MRPCLAHPFSPLCPQECLKFQSRTERLLADLHSLMMPLTVRTSGLTCSTVPAASACAWRLHQQPRLHRVQPPLACPLSPPSRRLPVTYVLASPLAHRRSWAARHCWCASTCGCSQTPAAWCCCSRASRARTWFRWELHTRMGAGVRALKLHALEGSLGSWLAPRVRCQGWAPQAQGVCL